MNENNHVSQTELLAFRNNIMNDQEKTKFLEHICSCDFCSDQLASCMEEELITAPIDMKQNILKAVKRPDVQLVVKAQETSKRMQLFLYSLRVGTATIGALIVLLLAMNFSHDLVSVESKFADIPKEMPLQNDSSTSFSSVIKKNVNNFNDSILNFSNKLMNSEDDNNDKKEK